MATIIWILYTYIRNEELRRYFLHASDLPALQKTTTTIFAQISILKLKKKKKTSLNVKQRTEVLVQPLFYIDKNVLLVLNLKIGCFSCNKDC